MSTKNGTKNGQAHRMAPYHNGEPAADRNGQTGRFTAGNQAARGHANPHARRRTAFLKAMTEAVSPEDLQALAQRLLRRAMNGDMKAAELLLLHLVGKPGPAPDPDRADLDEFLLLLASPTLEHLRGMNQLGKNAFPAPFAVETTKNILQGSEQDMRDGTLLQKIADEAERAGVDLDNDD